MKTWIKPARPAGGAGTPFAQSKRYMWGLRGKLLLGFGGLLVILLGVSLLGNTVLDYYSDATQRMLREDLDGIEAAQQIGQSIDSMDDVLGWIGNGGGGGLARALTGKGSLSDDSADSGARLGPGVGPGAAAAGDPVVRDPLASDARRQAVLSALLVNAGKIDRALTIQASGQSLPDEREVTAQLTDLWTHYRSSYPALLQPGMTPEQRREVYSALAPQADDIKRAAEEVFHINVNNMRSNHGEASATARSAQFAMHALTLCGAILASGFAVILGRLIVGPVRTLTESVQQVQRGNLDLEVPVRSNDELGRLGEAFNEMASQLRVFRRIDHEKLTRSQRTTQLAIDSLPDAVIVTNPQGGIELTNQTAKRLFGLRPGVPVDSLPDKRLAELHRRAWRNDKWGGEVEHRGADTDTDASTNTANDDGSNGHAAGNGNGTAGRRTAGAGSPAAGGYGSSIKVDDAGHDRFFLPRSAPILDERRHMVGLTIVLADVTDFRRLDEMKNGLLSTVSHELKTPLTSMRMILHLVVEQKVGPLTPRQSELLVAAREDSDRLHEIIENLLDMGRIESGMALMELRPADAAELVWSCIEPMRPAFRAKGVALQFDPPPATPAVLADPVRVRHVFNNLLANALRYTPAGGAVRVGLRQALDGVEFTVADTGPGIPQEYLHRIFEKFFRVPGQPGESGAGLGLAIVKDVVEAHGGAITVESAAGHGPGTTFRFTLRRAPGPDEILLSRSNGDATQTPAAAAATMPGASGKPETGHGHPSVTADA
jgi:signal transduction histidine kinase